MRSRRFLLIIIPLCQLVLSGTAPADPLPSPPVVSLVVTYDPNTHRLDVRAIMDHIREHLDGRDDFLIARESVLALPEPAVVGPTRRQMVNRARRHRADFAVDLRFVYSQIAPGSSYTKVIAWTVSADSGAYALVAEARWVPGDTLTMRREIGLLMDRLLPPTHGDCCYAEVADERVTGRYPTGARTVSTTVTARTKRHVPAPAATVWGHWTVNTRPQPRRMYRADQSGIVRIAPILDPRGRPIPDAGFLVDSVACDGLVFDPQWPQREADMALALLENARADLDEERDFRRAIRRSRAFSRLTEEDVRLHGTLMTPLDAPDRRVQALNLLHRAQAEQDSARMRRAPPVDLRRDWAFNFYAGYDLMRPNEGDTYARPYSCSGCATQALNVKNDRRTFVGLRGYRRLSANIWGGIGASWSADYMHVSDVESDTRHVGVYALSANLWSPYAIADELRAYGDVGFLLNHRNEQTGRRYWVSGHPYPSPLSGALVEDMPPDVLFLPGVELGVGALYRVSDWHSTWLNIELRGSATSIGNNRTSWQLGMRLGAYYWQ